MNVTLPSGLVIKDIPDGTNKMDVMRKAIGGGVAKIEDFYPSPNIKAAEDAAVQGEADKLSGLDKGIIGLRETTTRMASRIPGLVDEAGQQQAAREHDLTKHVSGWQALLGRSAPAVMATSGLGGGIAANALGGAASGALTADDPLTGAAAGGILGGGGAALGQGLGRLTNSYQGKFAERAMKGEGELPKAMESFQSQGGRFLPGEADPKSMTKGVMDWLTTRNPLTAGGYHGLLESNQKVANSLAAKSIGVESDVLSPSVLAKAKQVMGQKFDAIAARAPQGIDIGSDVLGDLNGIVSPAFLRTYGDEIGGGIIQPSTLLKLRSKLTKAIRTSPDKSEIAGDLLDHVDDAFNKAVPADVAKDYGLVREQWKNWTALKMGKAIRDENVVPGVAADKFSKIYGDTYRLDSGVKLPETQKAFDMLRAMSAKANQPKSTSKLLLAALAGGGVANPLLAAKVAAPMYAAGRIGLGAPNPLAGQLGGSLGSGVGSLDILKLLGGNQ